MHNIVSNEINILDGITSSAAELNKLTGVESSSSDINKLSGVSPGVIKNNTTAVYGNTGELNETLQIDGSSVTATATELNLLQNASGEVLLMEKPLYMAQMVILLQIKLN